MSRTMNVRRVDCGKALARARSGRRLTGFLVAYLLLVGALGWRLVVVQVVSADQFRALAQQQTQREVELPARRGRLYDRTGEPLAMSLSAATVYANPRLLRKSDVDPAAIAEVLSPLLDRSVSDLTAALEQDKGFVYLARHQPREVGDQVREMRLPGSDTRLPGIGVIEEPKRVYPSGSLAAQVVGFAGIDNEGLLGMEQVYDDTLAGQAGRLSLEGAPGGLTIDAATRELTPPEAGSDVVLTIDRQIQYTTERVLAAAVEEHGAIGGSAVVLDVDTGQVLAMASVPTFDPAEIGEASDYARRNRVVTDVFEPGSVNKAITAAAALEEGLVTPTEVFSVDDTYESGGRNFSDSHSHPREDMTFAQIIAESSNVGTIQVAERLGKERLYDYLRAFGYGETTGLGFPGESAGLLAEPADWWPTSLPTIAIGQGVSATLLQVAGVFETVASGGERVMPSVVRGTVGADGRLDPAEPSPRERVVSPETAAMLSDMLVGVVAEGSGTRAAVEGYRVAGKTGTAQKPLVNGRGYEPGAYIATFAGFAPADDPELVVAVMLDEPRPVYYGGLTSAPAFSEIMDFALEHRRVPPSDAPVHPEAARVEPVDGSRPA